jgi:stage IV sporulation protein FB
MGACAFPGLARSNSSPTFPPVGAFHLFTIAGIPVSVSPFYLLLLVLFARGGGVRSMLVTAVCITVALLVHELGHALVARQLRRNPSILLHGFGGATSHERTERDVDEAMIIAMGPATGLFVALLLWGLVWLGARFAPELLFSSDLIRQTLSTLLYLSVTWNVLNLLPLWPLDGGQLLRLGAGRKLNAALAAKVTHGVALALTAGLLAYCFYSGETYTIIILALLGLQNYQALREGGASAPGPSPRTSEVTAGLAESAREQLEAGNYKEAVRLAHQARSQSQVGPKQLDTIWEVLGLANAALGDHEEALRYLRRAQPSRAVRQAVNACLAALDMPEEIEEVAQRWQATASARARDLGRYLPAVIGFIVVAVALVFTTSLSRYFL